MGKNIIAQRRGRGTSVFRSHGFHFKGEAKVLDTLNAIISDIVHCPGHTAPLMALTYDDGSMSYAIAPEGVRVGDELDFSDKAELTIGSFIKLKDIPEGIQIFNIEGIPKDGGKFVRATGSSARVVSKNNDYVVVEFNSRKQKKFNPNCKAMIGFVAGGGRVEKPFLNAGRKFHLMKARNKYWPKTSASAMNAVAHPFGNKRTLRKSKAKPAPKNAPPGRLVGAIRPRRTGRKK